jgi:spermidine synthase
MPAKSKHILLLSLFVLGFSSLFTQVFLLREFLVIFNGNELVLGIVLANWMLLTGFGAYLGRFSSKIKGRLTFLLFLQLLYTLLPLLTVVKLDLWRALMIPYGTMAGLTQIIYSSFLIQFLFCVINGFLFSSWSSLAAEAGLHDPGGRSYAIEAIGSVTGGILVNFLLLWVMDTYSGLRILLWINLCLLVLNARVFLGRKVLWGAIPLALAIAIIPLLVNLKGFSDVLLYPNQKIVYSRSTPYGKVVVTKNAGQLNFYENGLLLFSSGNEILNEEVVHFAMVQHPQPKSVLVIGGGISGIMGEILKYHPSRIDYAELNPAIVEAGRRFHDLDSVPGLRVFIRDGRLLLKKEGPSYDVVLVDLPEPSTIQVNRYYTLQFFREVKKRMNPGGVIELCLPSTADYVSPVAGRLNSVMDLTLGRVFRNVLILPGQKNYFLASDSTLRTDVGSLVEQREIPTLYVNPYYFDDNLLKDRSHFIMEQILPGERMNRDFHPVAYFLQLQYWTTFFRTDYLVLAAAVLVILLIMAFTLTPVSLGLFTGGFTASSLEIAILLAFQVLYGAVYRVTGVIITIFMAGLFLGSWARERIFRTAGVNLFIHLQLTLVLFTLGFPFIILAMNVPGMPFVVVISVVMLLTFITAFLVGLEFSLAAAICSQHFQRVIAQNYSADLFGSALGAILMAVVLLPFLGLTGACLAIAGLDLLAAGFLFTRRKKFVTL